MNEKVRKVLETEKKRLELTLEEQKKSLAEIDRRRKMIIDAVASTQAELEDVRGYLEVNG